MYTKNLVSRFTTSDFHKKLGREIFFFSITQLHHVYNTRCTYCSTSNLVLNNNNNNNYNSHLCPHVLTFKRSFSFLVPGTVTSSPQLALAPNEDGLLTFVSLLLFVTNSFAGSWSNVCPH